MYESEQYPEYSIDKIQVDNQTSNFDPKIKTAVKLDVPPTSIRCVKGDCCMDCVGNRFG